MLIVLECLRQRPFMERSRRKSAHRFPHLQFCNLHDREGYTNLQVDTTSAASQSWGGNAPNGMQEVLSGINVGAGCFTTLSHCRIRWTSNASRHWFDFALGNRMAVVLGAAIILFVGALCPFTSCLKRRTPTSPTTTSRITHVAWPRRRRGASKKPGQTPI